MAMSRTKFQNNAFDFLSEYKHRYFPETADGEWREKQYGHIFVEKDAPNNFLIPKSEGFSLQSTMDSYKLSVDGHLIALHRDWSHLNSSQVLCINYFYDFLHNTEKLKKFVNLLGINMEPVSGEFEVDPGDGSSIDFVVNFVNGKRLFCEIKYTESDFGKANAKKYGFDFYQIRKQNIYKNISITDKNFIKYYQIVRNIGLAADGNHTLFLYPSENTSVSNNLERGLSTISNASEFNYHRFTWEELIKAIPNKDVQKKYFPYIV